jgi:hypothetical protein
MTFNQSPSTTALMNANGTINPPDGSVQSKQTYGTRTWTGRYNGAYTPNWSITANYSNYYNSFTDTPLLNGYEIRDNTPVQAGTGGSSVYGGLGSLEATVSKVNEFTAASTHVFRLLGGHTVQYGYQFEDDVYNDIIRYTGANFVLPTLAALGPASGQTVYGATFTRQHETSSLSSPIILKLTRGNYNNPNVATDTRYHALFAQDSWTFGRVTIKPGVRFEQQAMSGIQSHYVFSHNWAPRIGVIVDPFNNRRTKIDASWGRFFEKIPLDMAVRALSFETSALGLWYADPGAGNQPNLSTSSYIPGGAVS